MLASNKVVLPINFDLWVLLDCRNIGNNSVDQKVSHKEPSCRVLDSRPMGRGFEPHRRHCVVVLEQDTFILA